MSTRRARSSSIGRVCNGCGNPLVGAAGVGGAGERCGCANRAEQRGDFP